jgi:hypothetical protein
MKHRHLMQLWNLVLVLSVGMAGLSWYALLSGAWPLAAWPLPLAYGVVSVWIFRVGRSTATPEEPRLPGSGRRSSGSPTPPGSTEHPARRATGGSPKASAGTAAKG